MSSTTPVADAIMERLADSLAHWCVVTYTSSHCEDYPEVGRCLMECWGPMTYDSALAWCKVLPPGFAPHILLMHVPGQDL